MLQHYLLNKQGLPLILKYPPSYKRLAVVSIHDSVFLILAPMNLRTGRDKADDPAVSLLQVLRTPKA